ncbi:acetylcholine receptor subunit beta-like 2 [Hyposmocoma kahamanoa]|uniref:acetylcholine receptor subunit beta-like 2 n=1 Tax=Hyposmocoma kahamanoa TaxID=1477025 RepID=UPI000E6D5B9E|nr:acetylcholine receptor subunit beta-like 2 [Hyposmocoma kahamanoa]
MRSPSTHTMSPWMKKLFLQFMPKLLMMRRTKYSLPDYDDTFVSNGYTNELEMRYPSVEMQAEVLAKVYHYKMERSARSERTATQEVKGTRRMAAQRMRDRWETSLADSSYGVRIIEAIRPVLDQWVDRRHGLLTHQFVQVLSGRGCFGHYLHTVAKREASMFCHECCDADDTAQHTLEVVEDWKFMSMVLDRFFLWLFTIACFVGTFGIIFQSPSLYDTRVPVDQQISSIPMRKNNFFYPKDIETIGIVS